MKSSLENKWNIIDYKSSYAYSKHHLKQVRYYVNAVREITGDEVDGYICYLLANEIKLVKVRYNKLLYYRGRENEKIYINFNIKFIIIKCTKC